MSSFIIKDKTFSTAQQATDWLLSLSEKQEYQNNSQVEVTLKIQSVSLAVLMPLKKTSLSEVDNYFLESLADPNKRKIAPIVACLQNTQPCLKAGRALSNLLLNHYVSVTLDTSRVKTHNSWSETESFGIANLIKTPEWSKGFPPQP
ncbi:MAG: hypothetical protein VX777_00030 [Chlamydiota bacterium]|nr:hypothetical protein [Chlamydiota bacterium]